MFKVGDKVRCVVPYQDQLVQGLFYIVSRLSNHGAPCTIGVEGIERLWWDYTRFELADAKKPHKHAELIKAWADNPSLVLQWKSRSPKGEWYTFHGEPDWNATCEVRIKPEPKPDVVYEHFVYDSGHRACNGDGASNVKFTFDGDTGKLKSVEIIK